MYFIYFLFGAVFGFIVALCTVAVLKYGRG